MANLPISQLSLATQLETTDLLAIVSEGVTKRVTLKDLSRAILSGDNGIVDDAENGLGVVDGKTRLGGALITDTTIDQAGKELRIGNGVFLSEGTSEESYPVLNNTTPTKMLWYPKNYVFRAGFADNDQWSEANSGLGSVAFGQNNVAKGLFSMAHGKDSQALGTHSLAFGNNVEAGNGVLGHGAIALGDTTKALNDHSLAIGSFTEATGNGSFVLGKGERIDDDGGGSTVNPLINDQPDSFMVGFNSDVPTLHIGSSSGAGTSGAIAIGAEVVPGTTNKFTIVSDSFQEITSGIGGNVLVARHNVPHQYDPESFGPGISVSNGADQPTTDGSVSIKMSCRPQNTNIASSTVQLSSIARGFNVSDFAIQTEFNDSSNNRDNLREVARFTSEGRVGIGTDTPREELEVNGNVRITGDLIVDGASAVGNNGGSTLGFTKSVVENDFVIGDMIYFDGTNYVKAIADLQATSNDSFVTFIVRDVNGDEVTFDTPGASLEIDLGFSNQPILYLSDKKPGSVTSMRPSTFPFQQIGFFADGLLHFNPVPIIVDKEDAVKQKEFYDFSMTGEAINVNGFLSKSASYSGNPSGLATTNQNQPGIVNGQTDPYAIPADSTVKSITVTFAKSSVDALAVGDTVSMRLKLYKSLYDTVVELNIFDIILDTTKVNGRDNFNSDGFQTATLSNIDASLTRGDLIGLEFESVSGDEALLASVGRLFVTMETEIN